MTRCTRARFTVLCHAVVSLQLIHVRSFAWPSLGTDFSTVVLCVTIVKQKIFKGSLQVAIVSVLPNDVLAGNAAIQWLLIAVSHLFLYCVKRITS